MCFNLRRSVFVSLLLFLSTHCNAAIKIWFSDTKMQTYETVPESEVKFTYLEYLLKLYPVKTENVRGGFSEDDHRKINKLGLFVTGVQTNYLETLKTIDKLAKQTNYINVTDPTLREMVISIDETISGGNLIFELYGSLTLSDPADNKLLSKALKEMNDSISSLDKLNISLKRSITLEKPDFRISLNEAYALKLNKLEAELKNMTKFEVKTFEYSVPADPLSGRMKTVYQKKQVLRPEYAKAERDLNEFKRNNNYGKNVSIKTLSEYDINPNK